MDKDKGYIDLSKRRVSPEDIERCTEIFSKAKAVNSILRHVAQIQGFKSNEELEDLYRKTAWKFEAKNKKKGSSYDWFKQVNQGHGVFKELYKASFSFLCMVSTGTTGIFWGTVVNTCKF